MRATRAGHSANCQRHLGDNAAAAKTLWTALVSDGLGGATHLALPLFQLYKEAKQLDDLARMVIAFEKAKLDKYEKQGYLKETSREEMLKYLPTQALHELRRIEELAKQKDVDALIKMCVASNSVHCNTFEEHTASTDWRCKAAAEALAACDGRELEPLRNAISNRQGTSISWLIYSLGLSRAPGALDVLKELAAGHPGYNAENVAFAISLRGEAGRAQLMQIAGQAPVGQPPNGIQHASSRWLEFLKQQPHLAPRLPVKPGSLPKEYPIESSELM